jgi:hypothetical protein
MGAGDGGAGLIHVFGKEDLRSQKTKSSESKASPATTPKHGGYRIMVITPVCGTGDSGSIPGNRPF